MKSPDPCYATHCINNLVAVELDHALVVGLVAMELDRYSSLLRAQIRMRHPAINGHLVAVELDHALDRLAQRLVARQLERDTRYIPTTPDDDRYSW